MNIQSPRLVVEPAELCPVDDSLNSLRPIPTSRMFEIKKALAIFHRDNPGGTSFDASQGDGGASLPGVPREVLEEAHALQLEQGTSYDTPAGAEPFRRACIEDYWQLDAGLGWGPDNVIACQGGRDALLKAYEAAQFLGFGRKGDFVVTSSVPWISYNWGPYGVGANVLLAPGNEADGWPLTPEGVEACVEFAAGLDARRVALAIVTSPDNPTGNAQTLEQQVAIAKAAFRAGVPFVLFDWIYHRLTDGEPHDLNRFLVSFEPEERERCIILDGITKSLGASNIRNAHLLCSSKLAGFIKSRASHGVIPSFHGQAVAIAAYRRGFDQAAASILVPTGESRQVLREFVATHDIRSVLGQGYYAFFDVGPWLDRCGMADSGELGTVLAEKHGLAVVPGVYFSEAGGRWIRFSYALEPETTRAAADRLWSALESMT